MLPHPLARLPTMVLSGLLLVLVVVLVTVQTAASGSTLARFEPRNGQTYLGVSTHLITTGVDGWDRMAGISTHPALYGRWTTPDGPFQPILDEVNSRQGITPIIHWNLPMDGGQITDGSHDAYVLAQAAVVKAYGQPVFVRLDWEMNAYWYKHWNPPAVTPTQFIASWRHVVALFNAQGVTNVAWVWAPNVNDLFSKTGQRYRTSLWYPGDGVVDWIGLDAYPQSSTPATLLAGTDGMNQMAQFAAAHQKPMMLAEWAPNLPHPDSADPINLVLNWAERYPNTVKALVYFDYLVGTRDFRLSSHPVGAATLRARTANRCRYLLNLSAPSGCVTTSTRPPLRFRVQRAGPFRARAAALLRLVLNRRVRSAELSVQILRGTHHRTIARRRVSGSRVSIPLTFAMAGHYLIRVLISQPGDPTDTTAIRIMVSR